MEIIAIIKFWLPSDIIEIRASVECYCDPAILENWEFIASVTNRKFVNRINVKRNSLFEN